MMPIIPKEQSIIRQKKGMPRIGPQTRAKGMIRIHEIIPNSITQIFFTGSFKGPMNAMAMTMWANASQSVPYDMKGYFWFVTVTPWWTNDIQCAICGQIPSIDDPSPIIFWRASTSALIGKAVIPLTRRAMINNQSNHLTLHVKSVYQMSFFFVPYWGQYNVYAIFSLQNCNLLFYS